MHSSFLSHAGGRYFWVAIGLMLLCIVAYLLDDPHQVPKRNFTAGWGTVRGWVSAHVYLGASLLVIATLHTGFQFGVNVHTLAYGLMCLVIFSGFFGIWAYRYYPEARNDLKRSQTLDDIFLQLEEVDSQIKREISTMAEDVRGVITSAIERTEVGGGLFAQLRGTDNSKVIIDGNVAKNTDQGQVVSWLVQRLTKSEGDESRRLAAIVRDYGARQKILRTIRTDIKMSGIQEVWLYLHVPLSFGLLAALIAHIVSVFIYW
jgi:hypothetical protein